MNVQLDTNIVIDILQERMPHYVTADQLLQKAIIHQHRLSITANSIDNIVYVVRKKITHKQLFSGLSYLFQIVDITAVNKTIILHALSANWKDFEDAIQYFSAIEAKADIIVTRDAAGYEDCKIQVLTPTEALKLIERG